MGIIGDALGKVPVVGGLLGGPETVDPEKYGEQYDVGRNVGTMDHLKQKVLRGAYRDAMAGAQGRDAAQLNTGMYDQARDQQMAMLDAFRQQKSDQSLAQQQMNQGVENAIAAQRSAAASARGMSPALAQRIAANQMTDVQNQAVRNSAMLRAQETANANNAMAGLLGQVAGQDINVANQNLGAQMQQRGMNDQLMMGAMQAGMGFEEGLIDRRMQAEAMRQKAFEDAQRRRVGIATGNMQAEAQHTGALAGMAGAGLGAAMMSDRNVKTSIKGSDKETEAMLDALKSQSWEYKDKKHGEGRWNGVMAQDLEKSSLGREAVMETPEGKALDPRKVISALLAGSANINKRLRKLEGAK